MKIVRGHGERVQMSLRVPERTRARLAKLAAKQDISINELLAGWVEQKLKEARK